MASSKARSRNRPAPGKGNRTAAAKARDNSRTAGAGSTRSPRTPQRAARQPEVPVVTATPTSPAKPVTRPASQARPAKPERADTWQPAEAAPEPVRPAGPPLWLQFVTLALAVLGLAVSAYETYAHFNGNHLAGCPTGGHGTFNCTAVITSPQSMVLGVIPVAVLGLIFYVFVVAIMTPWAWRTRRREVHWVRLASMVAGMGFVMYLIYAELYQIQAVCEYCTGVHIITFLLFCVTLVSAAVWGLGKPERAP